MIKEAEIVGVHLKRMICGVKYGGVLACWTLAINNFPVVQDIISTPKIDKYIIKCSIFQPWKQAIKMKQW